jgi:TolB protein
VRRWSIVRWDALLRGCCGTVLALCAIAWAGIAVAQITSETGTASGPIKMYIVGPSEQSKIAISQLKNLGGDEDGSVSGQFVHTLTRDLQLSGFFQILNPQAFIEKPQDSGFTLGQFNFADWSSINALFLVKGSVTASDQQVTLQAFLFDVPGTRQLLGKQFTGSGEDVGRMARRFADAVMKQVTSVNGPFDSRIAMVSTRGGRFKEIYTMSVDGEDMYRITNNPTINLFPSFDHQVRRVLYVSYKSGAPGLYLYDLDSRRETHIVSPLGNLIGGTLVPSGDQVVAAVERQGATNLYLLGLDGSVIRQFTSGASINVSPAVSNDGSRLAFTSDRGGSPQVYVMSMGGGAAQRITYKGNYNSDPAFSPDGSEIAYQSRTGGTFEIYEISSAGGEPVDLTGGQHPSWSPDGRYIVFSIGRGSGLGLFLIQGDGGKVVGSLTTEEDGNATDPAWSWWLGE